MATFAPTRSGQTLPRYTTVLAGLFAAACAAMAIYVPLFDNPGWELFFSVFCVAAAVLVATGVLALGRGSPRLAVALVTLGALVGALFLVWTLIAPILALALIVVFARGSLRSPSGITR
jgi:hypothetical protein